MITKKPRVGGKMKVWFGTGPNKEANVISVSKYNGLYKNLFTWTVRLSADTPSGSMYICI